MQSQSENPALPLQFRVVTLVETLALLATALGRLCVPALAQPLWPWPLGAFDGLLAVLFLVGLALIWWSSSSLRGSA